MTKPNILPIHLNVPAATKGRWVRASRAVGMRLTDWIVDAVEAHMQQQQAQRQHGGEADPVAEEKAGQTGRPMKQEPGTARAAVTQ